MSNIKIVVRAFNNEGYHKDILIASERQVHMNDRRIEDPLHSAMTGLVGHGAKIDPSDFPEMTHFEVVITQV